jgi:type I restriction enzyme M protein
MSTNDSQQIVNKAWNFAHVLRDDGVSYMAYTEQITFLLFLKMADEQSKAPYNKKPVVPDNMNWQSLLKLDGEALELHYRKILEELGKKPGMLGEIFKKARQEIQNPSTLRRLIVDLIGAEQWSSIETSKGTFMRACSPRVPPKAPKVPGNTSLLVN